MEAEQFARREVESITIDIENPAIVLRMKDGTEVRHEVEPNWYDEEDSQSPEEEV